MADTNFSQFDPAAANQENDATYQADTQRTGGVADGQTFPSVLANKLFYQVTTWVRAMALTLVSKGYSPKDGSAPYNADTSSNAAATALASVLANIVTNKDLQSSGAPYGGAFLVSPTLSGAPVAPTPATGDNSTKLPTTAYVKAQQYVKGSSTPQLIQSGVTGGAGSTVITFSPAFSGTPAVTATPLGTGTANISSVSSSSVTLASSNSVPLHWIAVGPA